MRTEVTPVKIVLWTKCIVRSEQSHVYETFKVIYLVKFYVVMSVMKGENNRVPGGRDVRRY